MISLRSEADADAFEHCNMEKLNEMDFIRSLYYAEDRRYIFRTKRNLEEVEAE